MAKQHKNNEGGCTGKGWKPGQSGNPDGRPPSRPIAAEIKKLLEKNDWAALKAIAKKGLAKAKAGDFRFWKELMDRVDGKVLEQLELTQPVEDPLPEDEMAEYLEWRSKRAKAKAKGGK